MTSYEILTLIISVVAIIASIGIPLAGYLHKRLQKPSLDIYEFEYQPLVLMFSTLGNRIKLNFSILCKKASCVIRSIEADIFSEANAKQIKMRWVIMEPIRLDWANGMGSVINLNSMTLTHPFLVDADTLVPLSVQFEPMKMSFASILGKYQFTIAILIFFRDNYRNCVSGSVGAINYISG